MSKVFTEACAPSFDTPKRSLLPAYRVERSFDLSGPANAGGQEHLQAVTADSGKMGRLDHHLTTPSSRPVPCIVFYAPTFFYNHHNQRRKLCTPHNFRRWFIPFSCTSQFSDSKGQRFESPRPHQKGRCIAVQRPFLFCHGLVLVNPFFDYVRGNIGHDRHGNLIR